MASEVPKWRQTSPSGRPIIFANNQLKELIKKRIIAKTLFKLTPNLNISLSMNFNQMKQIKVSKLKSVYREFTKKLEKLQFQNLLIICWGWTKAIHLLNEWLMLYNNSKMSANWIDYTECSKFSFTKGDYNAYPQKLEVAHKNYVK